jgi:steroid 5-alpha reductase family enzyme
VISLTALGVVVGLWILVWLVSLGVRDASIADLMWGLGFVVVAGVTLAISGGHGPRRLVVAVLTTLWALRLTAYLAWRNLGSGEDYRYRAMRRRYGARFPLISLASVFLLQAALVWIVSLPIQAAILAPDRPLSLLDAVGAALWVIGLAFEAVGDGQLARFKRDPASRGRVMDRGLWRYTRHPNYFGDCMIWWGLYLFALAAGAWWAIIGPVVMTILLLRVSGVAMLEKTIVTRRPDYADYVARTSTFIPWPPRRRAASTNGDERR